MPQSASQLTASRQNLQTPLRHREAKALHIEVYGSCSKCKHGIDLTMPERCKRCINGGGKDDLFEPKAKIKRGRKQ